MSNETQVFKAVYVDNGAIRQLWFESQSEEHAREFCKRYGAGLEGPAAPPDIKAEPLPEAYEQETARRLLGGSKPDGKPGISLATLYRMLAVGTLDRVNGTRRLLVTRQSIERVSRQQQEQGRRRR